MKAVTFIRMRKIVWVVLVFMLAGCGSSPKKGANEITVFAAASFTDVITEIAQRFEQEQKVKVRLNLAASGTLARQIESGAEADVYISANKSWMDYLEEKNYSKESGVLARNELVLIIPKSEVQEDLKPEVLLMYPKNRIAIGDPGYVPAGKYAMQVLKAFEVESEEHLLLCRDVRSALMMVELGEVDCGIVYKTDALQSTKVDIIYTFPEEMHDPVAYYQVLVSSGALAKEFYDYLYSSESKQVLTDYSFKTD